MFSVEEWQHLADDGVQSLADLRLLVHLHVQTIRHLIILKMHQINYKETLREGTSNSSEVAAWCMKPILGSLEWRGE